MLTRSIKRVAIVGAGMAGAACARALADAGLAVQVFDKARGPGGRLATRRMAWVDADGLPVVTRLDHGTPGLSMQGEGFDAFIKHGHRGGWLAEWQPVLADGNAAAAQDAVLQVPVPDNPELCRRLLTGVDSTWSCAVDQLRWTPGGWQLESAGQPQGAPVDAVLLALPPAQAAPLLGPHRNDWSRHAALAPMQPCWTLMGVADEASAPAWTLARPAAGPLAWVMRNDARPGRQRVPGQAHWVAHARAGWSRQHLEQSPEWVQQQLLAAIDELFGHAVAWRHATVHRWRYATPQPRLSAPGEACWWDGLQGLGVCGDFLGGAGVEGAWLSAQSLAAEVRRWARPAAEAA